MRRSLSRRAFLTLSAVLGGAVLTASLWRRIEPVVAQALGMEIPTTIPTVIGMESDPAPLWTPTPTPALTATVAPPATVTPGPTKTPTPTPWRLYLPWVHR